jgi:hypothetical protein
MPPSRSAGLLAFLLALPSLAVGLPPASEAAAASSASSATSTAPETPAPETQASDAHNSDAHNSEAQTSESQTSGANTFEASGAPGEAMDARLRRLSEAIRSRSELLPADQRRAVEGEPWLAAGAWGNGNGRGWVNRGWPNRIQGGAYYGRPVWANFQPRWGNFRNGPRFINW